MKLFKNLFLSLRYTKKALFLKGFFVNCFYRRHTKSSSVVASSGPTHANTLCAEPSPAILLGSLLKVFPVGVTRIRILCHPEQTRIKTENKWITCGTLDNLRLKMPAMIGF